MRRIALLAATIAGWSCAGCSTVGPVASTGLGGGYTYSTGRASQEFTVPPDTIASAATQAMADLRIQGVHQTRGEGGMIMLEGTTADDRRASVAIRPNRGTSRVSVRIGWFGDQPLSRAVMDRIGIRLGTLPPSAVPVDPPTEPDGNPFFSRSAIPDSEMLRDQADAAFRDSPVP
jgi:hypothetical protein